MKIRHALVDDAASVCGLLIRSITKLCVADHKNDPIILDRWVGNKSPSILAEWIADSGNTMLVAEGDAAEILAVGLISKEGEIGLNYVEPEARFKGVSRAMVAALEAQARTQGTTQIHLSSTGTARQFYLALGYSEVEIKEGLSGAQVYRMVKDI